MARTKQDATKSGERVIKPRSKKIDEETAKDSADGKVIQTKKKRRMNPQRKMAKEIFKQQTNIEFKIPKAPFQRLVREIAGDLGLDKQGWRFTKGSLANFQEAGEQYIYDYLRKGNLACQSEGSPNRKRMVTLMDRHLTLVKKMDPDAYFYTDPNAKLNKFPLVIEPMKKKKKTPKEKKAPKEKKTPKEKSTKEKAPKKNKKQTDLEDSQIDDAITPGTEKETEIEKELGDDLEMSNASEVHKDEDYVAGLD